MAFTHSKNSRFQYLVFLVGGAHTADEAYRLIKNELEDRELALRVADAQALRAEAKRMRAELVLEDDLKDTPEKLEAQADIAELNAHEVISRACYQAAEKEVAFLNQLLAIVNPHRKFSHLPDDEAFEACQREEWAQEFMFRAENFLLGMGRVPADQLSAMRKHPDWHTTIYPFLGEAEKAIGQGTLPPRAWRKPEFRMRLEALLPNIMSLPPSDIVRMLEGRESNN